jgi:hypothetical protein
MPKVSKSWWKSCRTSATAASAVTAMLPGKWCFLEQPRLDWNEITGELFDDIEFDPEATRLDIILIPVASADPQQPRGGVMQKNA